ncbi:MAG: hypothetical protein SPL80_08880, partial [Bacilli bacterium]|nr:hypothetical protein [Bacilli bacterium]
SPPPTTRKAIALLVSDLISGKLFLMPFCREIAAPSAVITSVVPFVGMAIEAGGPEVVYVTAQMTQ